MTAVHVSLCVLLATAAGCARTAADRPVEQPGEAAQRAEPELIAEAEERRALPPAAPAGPGRPVEITGVFIDDSLAAACGIPIEPEDYFEYDSAADEDDDNPLLRRLADCLTTGPLRDRKVELRGYEDPRRGDEFADRLGMSRAQSVSNFLTARGVAPDNVHLRPGGEAAAAPDAPSDWPYERRVDIVLMPGE